MLDIFNFHNYNSKLATNDGFQESWWEKEVCWWEVAGNDILFALDMGF
ncbi:MAG TPA: hypothetical protein VFM18_06150 [Methanosarcina sp.]|nr:hypothetical protein [Methanosarcina sp.]